MFVTLGQVKFWHGVSLEVMHIGPLAPARFCPSSVRDVLSQSVAVTEAASLTGWRDAVPHIGPRMFLRACSNDADFISVHKL
jgi:hypothetical protein